MEEGRAGRGWVLGVAGAGAGARAGTGTGTGAGAATKPGGAAGLGAGLAGAAATEGLDPQEADGGNEGSGARPLRCGWPPGFLPMSPIKELCEIRRLR